MKPDKPALCAFFAPQGGIYLKNRAFANQNELDHRKKLRVVLRQLTEDRLAPEQQLIIEQAVEHHTQYSLQTYASPHQFRRAISKSTASSEDSKVKSLFGTFDHPPMAILVRHSGKRRTTPMIFIYLPVQTEEER